MMERFVGVDDEVRGLLVGQAAELVGVSVKAIRTYHARGVLPEPERDESGYRRYGAGDLLALARVVRLRRIGLSLREIAPLISDDHTTSDDVQERLTELDRRLENEMAELELRRELIGQLLAEGVDDPVAVSPAQLWEEQAVAFLRGAVPDLTAEQELTERRLCRAWAAFVPTAELPDEDVVEAALAALAAQPSTGLVERNRRFHELREAEVDDPRVPVLAGELCEMLAVVIATVDSTAAGDGQVGRWDAAVAAAAGVLAPAQRRVLELALNELNDGRA